MKRVLLLAASALVLMAFVPEPADAQGRRFGVRGGVVRGPVYAYPRGYYGYRRGYRPGVGAAIGLGLGAAALGAAVAARLRTAGSHLFAAYVPSMRSGWVSCGVDGGSGSGTATVLRNTRLMPGGVTSRTARSCARAAGLLTR